MILEIIFWVSVLLILHTYLFYPLILSILVLGRKKNDQLYSFDKELPFVSVVISAYNEENVIAGKIESIYKSSFPENSFEVLIGSDASDDRTVEIIRSFEANHPSLRFFDFKERRGKGNVVNDLVQNARGNILILTDANVLFDKDTMFGIVKHFKNPEIGLVDTNMINKGMKKEGISYQEKAYISREVGIKNMEGRIWGAMMGPFGGCYAIRKEDYTAVPSNFLVDDFYINMKIFEKGKLAVNELHARVYEDVPHQISIEFKRKVRIGTGNWQNLRTFWRLLFTRRYGFAFWSHKVIRWIGPFLLILALISNALLVYKSELYLITLILQLSLILAPLLDLVCKSLNLHIKSLRLITHFYSMNLALLLGFFRSFKTIKTGVWERTDRG